METVVKAEHLVVWGLLNISTMNIDVNICHTVFTLTVIAFAANRAGFIVFSIVFSMNVE